MESDSVVLDAESYKRVIFVAYDDEKVILREAESLRMRKFKRPYDQKERDREKKYQSEYLDPRIIKYEDKQFFHANEKEMYEGGTFQTILSEGEIILCAYRVLTTIQLKNGAKNSGQKLPVKLYPPLNDEELIFYLLKHGYISEVVPLHSRSRHEKGHQSIFENVMKSYSAPVKEIREYYGESVAIYFEW